MGDSGLENPPLDILLSLSYLRSACDLALEPLLRE